MRIADALLFAALLCAASTARAHTRTPAPQPRQPEAASVPATDIATVSIDTRRTILQFSPLRAIGAGLDAQDVDAVATIYSPETVADMLSAGLGAVTYRLYTELGIQDWHWNPSGTWSQGNGSPSNGSQSNGSKGNGRPGNGEGYWTGSTTPGAAIENSFGYRLPHRGNTHDQANDDDYSRLTDGDAATYWKSNPYLTSHFTGDADTLHPQWVVVRLAKGAAIDAIALDWTEPRALDFRVQLWTGGNPFNNPAGGTWQDFPMGEFRNGKPGHVVLRIAASPINAGFVRVLMTRSSNLCGEHGSEDIRNCVGYALGEIGLGTLDDANNFTDLLVHAPNHGQSNTYASSTDPWHRAADRNKDGTEQVGLDRVFASGLTRGLPTVVPVAMVYGTPEDAAAEITYLESQQDQIARIELGEEPDGQYILPEDYAALYVQWAQALHAVDPSLQLGGPVFQGATSDVQAWPNKAGDTSWLRRFLKYLAGHGQSAALAFMSFEHYPFNACGNLASNLAAEPGLVRGIIDIWHQDGLPKSTPLYITELNYSAAFTQIPQQIEGAIWMADFFGSVLSYGGAGAFLYEYEPEPLYKAPGCRGQFGNLTMFPATQRSRPREPAAQYFAAELLTQAWTQPIDALHNLVRASVDSPGKSQAITAYALQRPDGDWAVMLINRDLKTAHRVQLQFSRGQAFTGQLKRFELSPENYVWHGTGPHGYALPDGPFGSKTISPKKGAIYMLPASSVTVLRGALSH
jgi:hypothetical protein